jgi:hypothetical protein
MDSHPIGTRLSYEVLQRRRERNELAAKVANDRYLSPHLLQQLAIDGRSFVADPDWGQPESEFRRRDL